MATDRNSVGREQDEATSKAREETIEECAKIAENFPATILQLVERPGGPPGNFSRATTGKDIAAAIRALATIQIME